MVSDPSQALYVSACICGSEETDRGREGSFYDLSRFYMTSPPAPAIALIFGGGVFWFPYLACFIEQIANLLISPGDQTFLIIPTQLDLVLSVLIKLLYGKQNCSDPQQRLKRAWGRG